MPSLWAMVEGVWETAVHAVTEAICGVTLANAKTLDVHALKKKVASHSAAVFAAMPIGQ